MAMPPEAPRDRLPEPENPLSDQRFIFSPETESILAVLDDVLAEARQTNPAIQGLVVLGSRTRGQERNSSDLDVAIVYDKEICDVRLQDEDAVTESINSRLPSPIPRGLSPAAIDISTSGFGLQTHLLEDVLASLPNAANILDWDLTNKGLLEGLLTHGPYSQIFGLFHYAIGEPVLRARHHLLDILSKHENGERLFRITMGHLQNAERYLAREKFPDTPLYQHFPETIDAARDFFDTTAYEVSDGIPLLSDPPPEGWQKGDKLANIILKDSSETTAEARPDSSSQSRQRPLTRIIGTLGLSR
jgi:predicted nucleotidyltransferase